MNKAFANLTLRQRATIGVIVLAVATGLYSLVHWQKEADFKPLYTGLAPEDAGAIVQKLKESGVEYRLPESGGVVMVPSGRLAELRLAMATAGLPRSGRIGFELFDKANLGATEFTEHVNYRRALEGELERSVVCLAEVEEARVHITFPKDSVFLDSQEPAKASVLVKIRLGAHLAPENVQAITHMVASAVEGLSPDAVSVLDMNGNLLSRPKAAGGLDGPDSSEAALEYRHKIEADLLAKINATLEPLLGAGKFRAGASVDCDFSGGEQSEELYDPAHSVMLSSQRSEDTSGSAFAAGVPGTPSNLPRPTSRPSGGAGRNTRVTENITYQASRTVRKTRLPAGTMRRMSLAVLVDNDLTWQKDKSGYHRVLVPPSADKLKVVRDLVTGVTGFNADRGDQLIVETQPFETTLNAPPPGAVRPPVASKPGPKLPAWQEFANKYRDLWAPAALGLMVLVLIMRGLVRFGRRGSNAQAGVPLELESGAPLAGELPAAPAAMAPADQLARFLAAPMSEEHQVADRVRELAKLEPSATASVLRAWMENR